MRYYASCILNKTGLVVAAFFLFSFRYSETSEIPVADKLFQGSASAVSHDSDSKSEDLGTIARARIEKSYGNLPLSFEENNGQTDEAVKFFARGDKCTLFITSTEAVLSLRRSSKKEKNLVTENPSEGDISARIGRDTVRLKSVGANPNATVTGLEMLPGKSNYLVGDDPAKWKTGISKYARIKIEGVYTGIDLVYYGRQNRIEHDWIVAPGADPKAISFMIEGISKPRIDARGNLMLDESGELYLNKPMVYQQRAGARIEVAGSYVLLSKHRVGFWISSYDVSLPLVIDPIIMYSAYLGGNEDEFGRAIAVDSFGNAYVTGTTVSANFPRRNPLQARYAGETDVFVTKLNVLGNALIYSTYLGGNKTDEGYGIAVDSSGNAYLTGHTESTDFPTANAFQAQPGDGGSPADAFVAKLNTLGDTLMYSTFLGGPYGSTIGYGIAVDSSGNAYVTGSTTSENFPTHNPYQAIHGGRSWQGSGKEDIFVTKLNPSGNTLVYSTYIGGGETDIGRSIAVDSSGSAYVTGYTWGNFPTVNPFDKWHHGTSDALVAKLSASGNELLYSTYLGGVVADYGYGIAVDSSGNAYVTGLTHSHDFPLANPFQAFHNPYSFEMFTEDAFVTKLNPAGNSLVYSTFLGGQSADAGLGIAVDSSRNAYVTGSTSSNNFPLINAFQPNCSGYSGHFDAFVTKLNASGKALLYSSCLGGSDYDIGRGIGVDLSGNAYVTGYTESTDFPSNEYQASMGGVFVTKIGDAPDVFFPEVAVGSGWSTTFALVNTGTIPAIGSLKLMDQQGNPFTMSGSDSGTDTSFPISILPGGSVFKTVNSVNPDGPAESGWARVEIRQGNISGAATYHLTSKGVVTALAGVLPSQPIQFATIPVDDNVNEARDTAYAIANPTSQDISIKLCLVDVEGRVVDDTVTIHLSPGQQIARYFFQDLNLSEFKGTIVLRALNEGTFVAVGLIQNQALFTVVPVVTGKAPNIPN